MEHLATPSTDLRTDHRKRLVTPRSLKRGPADRGKSQIPITPFYSPVNSLSEKSSQLFSSFKKGNHGSPRPKKRLRAKFSLLNRQAVKSSSGDSSGETFTDRRHYPKPPAVLPASRLDLVKRCLYPESSSQYSSSKISYRSKKKQLTTRKRKLGQWKIRVLSSEDSCEEVLYTPMDPKPLQDLHQPSSQTVIKPRSHNTSSQSVFITSSDDSDFELHNSKQSQSFASQSVSKDAIQLRQSLISLKRNSTSDMTNAFSPSDGSTMTQNVWSELCSTSCNAESTPKALNTKKSATSQQNVCFSPAEDLEAELDDTADPHYKKGRAFLAPEKLDSDGDGSEIPPILVEDCLASIYLEDTIPLTHRDATSIQQNPEKRGGFSRKTPSGSLCQLSPSRHIIQNAIHCVKQPLPCGQSASIYDEETVDPAFTHEATVDMDQTVGVGPEHQTTRESNGNVSSKSLEDSLMFASQEGGVIECSDDDLDESSLGVSVEDNQKKTNLEVIALSELMGLSHISGSDESDLPDLSFLDSEISMVDTSAGNFRRSPLSPLAASMLAGSSDDSSMGITPILNDVLDASVDFFSDAVSSFGTVGSGEEQGHEIDSTKRKDKQSEDANSSRAGDVGMGSAPNQANPMDQLLAHGGQCLDFLETESVTERPSHEDQTTSLSSSCVPRPVDGLHEGEGSSKSQSSQPGSGMIGVNTVDDTASTVTADESLGGNCETSLLEEQACEEISYCLPEGTLIRTSPGCSVGAQPKVGDSMGAKPADINSADVASPHLDPAVRNTALNEIKVICGSLTPDTPSTLLIVQNLDKTLLRNHNRPLLLDTILSECLNYAEPVLNHEPIKTFISQYSGLPPASKSALHCCLLELLEDSKYWLKYAGASPGSIDDVVSSGILEFLNTNNNLITKLNSFTYHELTDIFTKLNVNNGCLPGCSETLRNTVFTKLSSINPNDSVKKDVMNFINRKFIKLTDNASFCIKICLELFALPLNLNDKLYKTADIARFTNSLIRELVSSKFSTLPFKTSKMALNPVRVLSDLSDLCRLKANVFSCELSDESIYIRVNDVCSTIAVLDVSSETDPVVKSSPICRFLVTNYVHALDELLKKLLYVNSSDIEFGACVYLGFLLKQDVTGFQHKVKWCRERMRYLLKLLDARNIFEEFSKTLKEPVPPVESIVRTEFVSDALKIKKLGLTSDEKLHLMKLLRPTVHAKAQIILSHVTGPLCYYDVLTRKPKIKNFFLVRANIFEKFKSDFPSGIEDHGSLLMNAICMALWQTIYLPLDGVFVNKFQKSPLDWGSEQFFSKREIVITNLVSEMEKHGLPAVFKLFPALLEKFASHCCVVDWNLVGANLERIYSLVGTLGLARFLKIGLHLLEKWDERSLGFPEMVLWNPESKRVKFLGLKKPNDPLYPHQILWLEKLADFGVEAEELQISGYIGSEQGSRLK